MEFLCHITNLFNILKSDKLFSTATASFYTPNSNVKRFQLLLILTNTCYRRLILAIPVDVKWHFIVVSICISLMNNNVEHMGILTWNQKHGKISMCLLAICIFSLEKCLFKNLCPLKKRLYFYDSFRFTEKFSRRSTEFLYTPSPHTNTDRPANVILFHSGTIVMASEHTHTSSAPKVHSSL